MTLIDFKEKVNETYPPEGVSHLLKAMWYEANDEWNTAHRIAQDDGTENGSWVHAYLHRVEGDIGNADYWYSRAGKKRPDISLEQEWDEIVESLINNYNKM